MQKTEPQARKEYCHKNQNKQIMVRILCKSAPIISHNSKNYTL